MLIATSIDLISSQFHYWILKTISSFWNILCTYNIRKIKCISKFYKMSVIYVTCKFLLSSCSFFLNLQYFHIQWINYKMAKIGMHKITSLILITLAYAWLRLTRNNVIQSDLLQESNWQIQLFPYLTEEARFMMHKDSDANVFELHHVKSREPNCLSSPYSVPLCY